MENVGIVIVSHSPKVAEGAAEMVRQKFAASPRRRNKSSLNVSPAPIPHARTSRAKGRACVRCDWRSPTLAMRDAIVSLTILSAKWRVALEGSRRTPVERRSTKLGRRHEKVSEFAGRSS